MRYIQLLLLLLLSTVLNGQIITTLAGCSVPGYYGDGGPATAAGLHDPRDVVADRQGNIYISEFVGCVVRKVNTAGIITTVAGIGVPGYNGDSIQATDAELDLCSSIAVDMKGNIYIVSGARIRKVDTSGIITTIAGTADTPMYNGDGIAATAARIAPWGIAIDTIGNIYVGDANRLRLIDTFGIIHTIAGTGIAGSSGDGGPATAADLEPLDIAIDKYLNIYFTGVGRVRKITRSTGIISTIAGTGATGFSGDGGPATAAEFNGTEGISVDDTLNVYITDIDNARIRKISNTAIISTVAGNGYFGYLGDGGRADTSALSSPTGVFACATGKIYIADMGNFRIRCIGCGAPESIENVNKESGLFMQVSPNPVVDNQLAIFISSEGKTSVHLLLFNAAGQLLKEKNKVTTNESIEWQLNEPAGIYYLQAIIGTQKITRKIVIQ